MVTLVQLRALVAVVEAQGFAAAAVALGVSQSAISHSIAALEAVLGSPVILRGTRPLRPTPLGAQLLPDARRAVESAAALTARAAVHAAAVHGPLRVGAPPTVARGLMPHFTALWRAAHPKVRVSVLEGEDNEVAGWLEAGTVDLAVLVDPEPLPEGAVPFLHDDFRVALHSEHPLAGEREVAFTDLDDDALLLSDGGVERYLREIHRLVGRPYEPQQRIRGFATVLDMVQSGVGVAVVPGLAQLMMPIDTVLVKLRPTAYRDLYLCTAAGGDRLPVARALADVLAPLLPLDQRAPLAHLW